MVEFTAFPFGKVCGRPGCERTTLMLARAGPLRPRESRQALTLSKNRLVLAFRNGPKPDEKLETAVFSPLPPFRGEGRLKHDRRDPLV